MKLKVPSSSYISCIVESVKNKALIVRYKAKEKANKEILVIVEL